MTNVSPTLSLAFLSLFSDRQNFCFFASNLSPNFLSHPAPPRQTLIPYLRTLLLLMGLTALRTHLPPPLLMTWWAQYCCPSLACTHCSAMESLLQGLRWAPNKASTPPRPVDCFLHYIFLDQVLSPSILLRWQNGVGRALDKSLSPLVLLQVKLGYNLRGLCATRL